jgi:murein DD-endopeptidase MepM/ murein hydrolase activator NlpD
MKTFLIFLAGALLGSVAAWFLWLGPMHTPEAATRAVPVEPTSLPVTQPPPQRAPPKARPAIIREPPADAKTPPQMIPTNTPATETGESTQANAPDAPVDAMHAAVLPPESTPVAPIAAADGSVLSPPPPALPPLRELALLIPVAGVKPTQLLDTYTDTRSEGRSHDAIDIMAPLGTPVYAVEDGPVAKLFDSKQGGLTVYQFDRTGELAYYYAHLDRYAPGLAEKQALRRGDLVGYVGYTGNANPAAPHLHFAIFRLGPEKNWWKGTPINPYPHLRKQ